ncbi:MAG: rRNA pseudouridine synthase [Anaerolineae bacterium]|nr:rRNA pseudouridine synthase [Anaerolineae bacterium]
MKARPRRWRPRESLRYLIFYKPYGVLSTFTDPEGRPTLSRYIRVPEQVYAAGRLDMDSEGLLFLTNDGWVNHRLTHPRYKLPKVYLAQVEGIPTQDALEALRQGVVIKGRRTAPAEIELLETPPTLPPRSRPVTPHGPTRWLRIVLREGRKRQVRHMTAAVGLPTLRLVRVAIGPLSIRGLEPGQWRDLMPKEISMLRHALTRASGARY